MSLQEKPKKNIVITGRTILKAVAIIALIAMVATDVYMAITRTPILDIIVHNPIARIGFLLPGFILLLTEKSSKGLENKESDEVV